MVRCALMVLFLLNFGSVDAMARRVDVQVGEGDDNQGYYYQEEDVWYGPGWYNGVWFGTEIEFNDWHGRHHHDYHHQHYRNYDHHNYDHHGGGGHH